MNFEDFIKPVAPIKTQSWQLGSYLSKEFPEHGIALLFVSDYRGAGKKITEADFSSVRQSFYELSSSDFEVPLYDFGDLVSGKTSLDTHYIVQEIVSACLYKGTIPVIIGGSNDLAHALYSALYFHDKQIEYSQVSNVLSLDSEGDEVVEQNFLAKLLSSKRLTPKDYHHLGYQKHLNDPQALQLMEEVDFDVVRLSEIIGNIDHAEPYFRNANLVTLNTDAVESRGVPFSIHPQVNGLNNREICALMQEVGLGKKLKVLGVFNPDLEQNSILNSQLLAQMLWYFIEGVNIQRTHPSEQKLEKFVVMIDEEDYVFQRDVFTGLWYFGDQVKVEDLHPCTMMDYQQAKEGVLSKRIRKALSV